ncbi:Usa1p Ecym_4105 [Eremothecium cymbalariae DBVPG|uniref:Ubiquitin-like domain-containing protein n=1 Tax=Eremothecium cymbalariae (strain CBS 270.75 / DBVPG 7215 / KCTC 17166 / NRRL Y-17582) TaxID=931890 RepID=G8JT31_ERECY|nr:hypothetical protein Ecym_4105 [Eremothecium cymbalariae DBVPG\
MEYQALSPIRFSIYSSNSELTCSNLFVSASPKSSVARLLQFVHWSLYVRGVKRLELPSHYALKYLNQELALTTLCSEIGDNGMCLLRLELDRRQNLGATSISLEYDLETEFLTTNVQFHIYALSIEKFCTVIKYDIPLTSSISDLRRMASDILNEYETKSSKNLCSVKNHSPDDLTAFQIAGRAHPIDMSVNGSEMELSGVRLKDLLGFDFAPAHSSHCSIMFKANHSQDNNGIVLEFVSDSTLIMNKMNVAMDTTVQDVKEFICSVYGHALRISPSDIMLVYGGQLIDDANYAGRSCRILEYISDTNYRKLHVKINEEFNQPGGPGFWSELFSSPDRFSFNPIRPNSSPYQHAYQHVHEITPATSATFMNRTPYNNLQHLTSFSSMVTPSDMSLAANAQNSTNPNLGMYHPRTLKQTIQPELQFFLTEDGQPLERTGEIFEKVKVNEKSFFVAKQEFDGNINELTISGHLIRISSDDYYTLPDQILLKPNVVRKIESILGTRVQQFQVPDDPSRSFQFQHSDSENCLHPPYRTSDNDSVATTTATVSNNSRQDLLREKLKCLYRAVKSSLPLMFTALVQAFIATITVVFSGIIFLKFGYVFGTFCLLCLCQKLDQLFEIWVECCYGADSTIGEQEMAALKRVVAGPLPAGIIRFNKYLIISQMEQVLASKLESDPELKSRLCENYSIEEDVPLLAVVPSILYRSSLPIYKDRNFEPLRALFADLLQSISDDLDNFPTVRAPQLRLIMFLRFYIFYKNLQRFRIMNYMSRIFLALYDYLNGGLMLQVLTDPTKDSFLLATAKNILLFILMLAPLFQDQFEQIMTQRAARNTDALEPAISNQENVQIQNENGNNNNHYNNNNNMEIDTAAQASSSNESQQPETIPTAPGSLHASGAEIHDLDFEVDMGID